MRKYEETELKYAATSRCRCGEGLAYPRDGSQPDDTSVFNIASDWWCSSILKGGESKGHDIYPFAMYEIKSEDQPSANGLTTRPKP